MVFFTCNSCGASLKKNQVEKHYQNECRTCEVLSCMDCGKDFYGDEYASHTKCISEAEKYQGALFKESGGSGATKGEKKQAEWLERVKQSASSSKVTGRIAKLLERIAEYPNIPRKRKKFENFVRNSINIRDQKTLSELWDAFNGASESLSSEKTPTTECTQNDVKAKVTSQANGLSGSDADQAMSISVKKNKKNEHYDITKDVGSDKVSNKSKKKKKSRLDVSSAEGDEVDKEVQTKKHKENGTNGEILQEKEHISEAGVTITERKKKKKEVASKLIEVDKDEPIKLKHKKKKRKCFDDDSLREPTKKIKVDIEL